MFMHVHTVRFTKYQTLESIPLLTTSKRTKRQDPIASFPIWNWMLGACASLFQKLATKPRQTRQQDVISKNKHTNQHAIECDLKVGRRDAQGTASLSLGPRLVIKIYPQGRSVQRYVLFRERHTRHHKKNKIEYKYLSYY